MAHFDLVSPRPHKDGGTRWHKVGVAFPRDKGGFQLVFDALPLPDSEGRVTLMMWEAKARDEQQGGGQSQGRGRGGKPQGGAPAGGAAYSMPVDDSDIPFAPCVLV